MNPKIDRAIEKLRPWIERRGMDPAAIRYAIESQFEHTEKLTQCSQASIEAAIARAVFLGLDLSPGADEAYLTPRKSRCVLVPGYRGLTAIAYQNPRVSAIEAHVVYNCDLWKCAIGRDPTIIHEPKLPRPSDANPVGAYAILWWRDSARPLVEYMTVDEINANANRGFAAQAESPWTTDWDQMARKTVVKRLLGRLPLAAPQQRESAPASPQSTTETPYFALIQKAQKADIPSIGAAIRADDSIDTAEKERLFQALNQRSRELNVKTPAPPTQDAK